MDFWQESEEPRSSRASSTSSESKTHFDLKVSDEVESYGGQWSAKMMMVFAGPKNNDNNN